MSYATRGLQQVVMYGGSSERLTYTVTDDYGRQQEPDAAPKITIYDTSGDALVSATNMSANSSTTEGFLAYDAQTAEFTVGQTLTGGTSGATALIVGQVKSGATGVLQLADINGTFQDDETITDGLNGSATANGTLYQSEYYYDLDASSSTNYSVAKNYPAKVTYDLSSRGYTRWLYFDVAFSPATAPWVTHSDVIREYPYLIGAAPEEWGDWTPAITKAHRKLVNKIHSLGDQAAFYIKRDQEMWGIEMAFTRQVIAEAMGEDQEKIDYWASEATEAWAARGEFTYDRDDDQEIDEDVRVLSSRFTR